MQCTAPAPAPYALYAQDWDGFTAKWKELSQGGQRLISLDTYVANGTRLFVGIPPAPADISCWNGDWSSFTAKWKESSQQGLRLNSLTSY